MLPSDEYARVTHVFGGDGAPRGAAVVYAVEIDPTLVMGVIPAFAGAVHDAFADEIMPKVCSLVNVQMTKIKFGPDEDGPTYEHAETDSGSTAPPCSPPQVAYLVHKRTLAGGRRGRGRMFLPGVSEGLVDESGFITTTAQTELQTALLDWQTALEAVPGVLNIVLEHEPPTEWQLVDGQPRRVPTGPAPDPTVISGFQADGRVSTQRRRLRG